MKKQFQSKAVPRGTRTIWRYLSALFILFTFAIGNVWAADPQDTYYKFTTTASANASIAPVSGDGGNIVLGSNSAAKITAQSAWYMGATYSHAININNTDAKAFSLPITASTENPAHVFVLVTSDNRTLKLKYGSSDVDQCSVRGTAGTSSYTAAAALVELVTTNSGNHVIYASGSGFVYAVRVVYEKNALWQEIKGLTDVTLDKDKTIADDLSTLYFFRMQDLCFNTDGVIPFANSVSGLRYSINFKAQRNGEVTVNYANPGTSSSRTLTVTEFTRPTTAGTSIVSQSVPKNTKAYADKKFDVEAGKEYVISFGASATIKSVNFKAACTKPAAPTALSCTAQTVNTLTFGWTKETNAVGYVAKLYSDSGCETEVDSKDLGNVNTVTFTGLSNSTTYYCKVQSKGNGTTYCEDGNVTAAANGTTETPSCGVVTAPTSLLVGATTADGAPFTIIDDADAYNYELYISESSSEPESSATATHTSTAKTKDVTGLTSGTTYYAWVRSVCDADHKSAWTAANKSFKVRTTPSASFADANYIIGMSAINVADNFTSNSGASVVYELKESYPNVTLSGSSFSATAAGEYVVVANQAGNADYTPISKEATVTVLDNELSDTYVWKKGTGYTGCVANPNADAPAAQYTDVTVEGMSAVSSGRPSTAGTTVTITFSVKAAYSSLFGIENICTYGKLEEPAGGQISWDGGTNWEDLAAYTEGKKEFAPAAGTFPTSFKIKFVGVSTSSGGLWWRNALVTLEVKKTVSGVTEALVGAEINGEAISAANLSTLQEDKTLDIATAYAAAPTVTFKKQVTTSYAGGWAPDVTNVDVEVTASDNTTAWQASATIGGQAYTINLAKPAGPSLETEATSITLNSAKIATDEQSFTFSGLNLEGNVTISLESAVAGMSVSPAVVTPTAGAITDEEVTITYKSLAAVAETNVNLVVRYNDDVKIVLPVTYSSTVGYEDLVSISAATTWDWNGAASAAVGTVIDKDQMIILANADQTWDENFNAQAIAGKLEYMCRDNKYAQGGELKFNTTVAGKVYVTYSNTGGNDPRTVNVNGTKGSLSSSNNKDADKRTESFAVSAGDVLIKGVQVSDDAAKYLRYYEVRFVPVFAVTYDAGEGSVKGGETLPTQADEAAGEKIVLAAATALEKDGYDFAGWLCNIDAQTYQPDDEYTMTAAATTFTAQWVLHVDPVDPTLTYDEGAYLVGGAALDLSSLITAQTSTGAISYSIKDAGTTGATLEGKNFSATAAGTAVITASQAAVVGYNAKSVDFNVVVTEPTEIDGIKMVVNNALTGNFRVKADQLKTGAYTVEGINYAKYVQMGSTHSSFSGETEGNQSKGIYYAPTKKNITFWFYMRNTESSTTRKIYVYTIEEGKAITSKTVDVEAGSHLVSTDITLTTNAEIVFGVENTKLLFCQIVAVESGDDLLQGGQNGYVFDYSKKRQNVAQNVVRTIDGIDYKLSAESKINSASNVQLTTLGTHYIKFHLDAPMTVNVYADNKKYYVGTECSTEDAAMTYEATGNGEFTLAAGNWYINGSGAQVKINKLSFMLPKCEKPTISAQPATNQTFGPGNLTATVVATVSDGGTLKYQWYDAATDEEVENATEATLTTTTEGTYYVIVTNTLADHSDNFIKSAEATLGYRVTDDATLSALSASEGTLDPAFDSAVENYNVNLAIGTTVVPTLTATATMNGYANVAKNEATEFVNYEAVSTVVVTSEDGTATKTYTVHFYVDHLLPQVDVTESTTWDWTYAAEGEVTIKVTTSTEPIKKNEEGLMANVRVDDNKPTNDATFNSQALLFYGENVRAKDGGRWYASLGHIKFNVTKPGIVEVEFSDNGSNDRCLSINGFMSPASSSKTDIKTFKVFVPAGEVTLMGMEGAAPDKYIRISKITFTANPTPDYTRTVSNNIGTLCVDHNVPVGCYTGATFYQIASRNEQYNDKIDFEEVLPTEELKAGEPYIFQSTTGRIDLFFGEETAATPKPVRGMIGNYGASTLDITEENKLDILYIAKNKLWNCEDLVESNLILNDHRAYIKMSDVPTYEDYEASKNQQNAAPRRRVTIGGDAPAVTTGIENGGLINGENGVQKVLINGQIFILLGEKMYDATGRLVK